MAANSIVGTATVTFDLVIQAGWPFEPTLAAETYERPGIDNYEAQAIGQRTGEFEWRGCKKWFTDTGSAYAHLNSCRALKGQIVQTFDPWNAQSDNVLILEVEPAGIPRPVIKDGATKYETDVTVKQKRLF